MVAAWTEAHERDVLLALCEEAQVPCGPVYAIDEIFADPHYAARGNLAEVEDERIGRLKVPNIVPRLSETPGAIDHLGEGLGGHVDAVYRGLLGLSEAELTALKKKGVI